MRQAVLLTLLLLMAPVQAQTLSKDWVTVSVDSDAEQRYFENLRYTCAMVHHPADPLMPDLVKAECHKAVPAKTPMRHGYYPEKY